MTVAQPIMWPSTLAINNLDFQIENMSRGGGPSISGKEQLVSSAAGRWTAKFTVILGTRSELTCFQALVDLLEGRTNPILISPAAPTWSPVMVNSGTAAEVAAPFGQGSGQTPTATFSDGSLFEQDGVYSYAVSNFYGTAPQALDTQMLIYCTPGPPLVGGWFSITPDFVENSRLHRIRNVSNVGIGSPWSSGFSSGFGPPAASLYMIGLQPPLRQNYQSGARLSFGRPFTPMRLSSDTSGAYERTKTGWNEAKVSFVEVF